MRPVLVLVTDAEAASRHGFVRDVAAAGVDWLQLRDRDLDGQALLRVADGIRLHAPRVRLIVNRRLDVAWAAGAHGVHLGFDALGADDARALLGPRAEVGISAHTPKEIEAEGAASYAHLAPIHAPLSKASERPALGLAPLRQAVRCGLPVIAQGGLCAENAREAVAAGASGVAVTGDILLAQDPARATRALREALDA